MHIRKAKLSDVKYIYKLLLHFSKKGDVIPRPLSELYERVREFFIAEDKDLIIGTCALHILWEDLAEIRSLVVNEENQRKGIGKKLVETALKEARELEIPKIFVLTTNPQFFQKLGFREVSKQDLPQKVWADCIKCSKFPECDEIPMLKDIG
ncbi:MAG: N-acetyltransferase [Thermodesulfobacteriaceae bacterium]|nr:N-acetyltransferase [Thermodesulfobacteriaceae bacterium]